MYQVSTGNIDRALGLITVFPQLNCSAVSSLKARAVTTCTAL